MSLRTCVFGLWHLGSVTAASLAALGHNVVGLDLERTVVEKLRRAEPPVAEPDLPELIRTGLDRGNLAFTSDPAEACAGADVLWVTFDTPVNEDDSADPGWITDQLGQVQHALAHDTLVIVSSQVPVGYTRTIADRWRRSDPTLHFACSPENLRLGQALRAFRSPDRVVVGLADDADRPRLERVFDWVGDHIEWMSLESAEMTKHALNGFLAASIAYTNEIARICERVGADASEVERGLRSEPRIGPRAYVSPGGPIGGGTLARDVVFMSRLAEQHGLAAPVLSGILASNRQHEAWTRERVLERVAGIGNARVALLGLTYKVGTDTLRRSTALELARSLVATGVNVRAYDPAVQALPDEVDGVDLAKGAEEALSGADVAVLATPWPEFRNLTADQLVRSMRRPQLVDQAGFLSHLDVDSRVGYVRVGRQR